MERWNQTMQRMLVKYCYKKKEEWATYLDNCVFAYNTSRHESSGFTPFQLMFNRQATLPIDINVRKASSEEVAVKYANLQDPDQDELQRIWTAQLDTAKANIKKAQEKQKLAFDKKHSNPDLFKKGQLVLKKDFKRKKRKGGKLDERYVGPFVISAVLTRGVYQLTSQDGTNVLKATGAHIKPYKQGNSVSYCNITSTA